MKIHSQMISNPTQENLDRSISELELSTRSCNCLERANIRTIRELTAASELELLRRKNFGRKSLEEIKRVLRYMNLSLHVQPVPERDSRPVVTGFNKQHHVFIPQQARGLSIIRLPFSVRLSGTLKRMGFLLLGDLHGLDYDGLLRSKNCGRQTVLELKNFVKRVQSGDFDRHQASAEEIDPVILVQFLDETVAAMPFRPREMLLMRFGGGQRVEIATLEEIGLKYGLTRERVRQILDRSLTSFRNQAVLSYGEQLTKMSEQCLRSVIPLTPELFMHWIGSTRGACHFSPSFYIRLLGEVIPELPAWPVGQKPGAPRGRDAEIILRAKTILGGELTPKSISDVFIQLNQSKLVKNLAAGEFLEALKRDDSIVVELGSPDQPTMRLASPKMRDWVRHVLSRSEKPLLPEEIIKQARENLGSEIPTLSPFSLANQLKPEDGFYLLDRRAFGLRHHFRLPVPEWTRVRADFSRYLEKKNRPISTSEVFNDRVFPWTDQSNSYEVAQILREDNRFVDLGRFLFALRKWGIEEREYIHDLIPKVLAKVNHPMTVGEVSTELQRFRSITPTSMASVLRKCPGVRDYGFGYYGLESWGEDSRAFLVSDERLVERVIARSEPPLSFGRLCEILKVSSDSSLSNRLWNTVGSLRKVSCKPAVEDAGTMLSHRSWSLERAVYSILVETNRPLPLYEIQWALQDRYGSAFGEKPLSDLGKSLDRDALFVRNTTGEYLLDERLKESVSGFSHIRKACFEVLFNSNEIVGCDDLLERLGPDATDVDELSVSMLASLLRGDEAFEEVGLRRFRVRR